MLTASVLLNRRDTMASQQGPAELEINERVRADDKFREALLRDPEGTLKREYGVRVPEGMKIKVHEETDQLIHLVVPGRPQRGEGPRKGGDTVITPMRRPEQTSCCTCGAWTAQTMNSFQKGCGC